MMRLDYSLHVAVAEVLSPGRIPRLGLPNIQDHGCHVGRRWRGRGRRRRGGKGEGAEVPLVPDCELEDATYDESPLDMLLLRVFCKLVAKHTGLDAWEGMPSIRALLVQG
jgi:hypothetical protein